MARIVAALLLVLGGSVALLWVECRSLAADRKAETEKKEELVPLKAFMRAKLKASELVLEGVVTGDFAIMEKGVLRLQLLTTAEEWKQSEAKHYLEESAEFRKILSRLKSYVGKRNLDGAALTSLEMNMSCVRCHQEMRKPRSAKPSEE